MGRHASADRRRRLAAWPVVLAVAVLVVAGLTVGYFLVVNSAKKTAACTGSTVLAVTAAPGAARSVGDAAAAFNATAPVARSTCVSVAVDVMSGAVAAAALAGNWRGQSSPAPGLWVADSAADVAALDAANSAMTAGHSNAALATSPVVLAVRTAAAAGPVSWAAMAAGAAGGPVLAIPEPVGNRASGYALESLAAAAARTPSGQAVDAAAVTTAAPLLVRLAAAVPTPPATTQAALTELAAGRGDFTAVPVVESDLAAFNAANSSHLAAAYPAGPTAGDELLVIPLTASWVTAAVSDAAAAFDAFLGDPKGVAAFAADDVRTSRTPPAADGVDLTKPVTALPSAGVDVRKALQLAWAATGSSPPATTATTATTDTTASRSPSSGTPATDPAITRTTQASRTTAATTTAATTRAVTTPAGTTRQAGNTATSTSTSAAGPVVTLVPDH